MIPDMSSRNDLVLDILQYCREESTLEKKTTDTAIENVCYACLDFENYQSLQTLRSETGISSFSLVISPKI